MTDEFAERLAEQRRLLESVRAGDKVPETGKVESTGWSAGRLVKAVVRRRRVSELSVQDAVTRRPTAEVGELIAEAVNSALADFRAQAPAATDLLPDLGAMSTQFREASEQGGQMMALIDSALQDVIAKVGQRTGMQGDPSPNRVDLLFEDTQKLLQSARSSLADFEGPQVTGEGSDEDEEVHAEVGPDGSVSITSLSEAAQQMSGEDLSDAALDAINEALEDWEDQREDGMPSADDVDEDALQKLSEQATALSEQSMKHFREYTTNLTAIMRSVGEP